MVSYGINVSSSTWLIKSFWHDPNISMCQNKVESLPRMNGSWGGGLVNRSLRAHIHAFLLPPNTGQAWQESLRAQSNVHLPSFIGHYTLHGHCTLHIARTAHSTTTLSALTRFLKKGGLLRRLFFCSKTNCKWTTYSFRTCCHSICHHLSLFVQLPDLLDVQMASPPPTLACPYTGIFPHQCHKCLYNCLVSVKPGPKTE